MTNKKALAKLKELSSKLDKVDYTEIIDLLKNSIEKIPIPIAKLEARTAIDRVRKNDGNKLYKSVDQLSYIKDKAVLENYLVEFGRANKPHEAIFYGAVESSLLGQQRITALAETSKLFQDPNGVNFNGELYTVSRWINSKELFLAEVVFSKAAIDVNPDIKRAFGKQTEFAKSKEVEDVEFYLDFLVFISEQFARQTETHHDYKISTAYTELVLQNQDIDGIAFPSVQTKYFGQNIALPTKIVDNFLSVEILATQILYKNIQKTFIGNHKNCLNPKECYSDIQWIDIESKYMATNEYIQNYLTKP